MKTPGHIENIAIFFIVLKASATSSVLTAAKVDHAVVLRTVSPSEASERLPQCASRTG